MRGNVLIVTMSETDSQVEEGSDRNGLNSIRNNTFSAGQFLQRVDADLQEQRSRRNKEKVESVMVEQHLSYMESQIRALLLRGEEKDRDFLGGLFVSKDPLQKDMVTFLKFLEMNLKKNDTHVHSLLMEQNEHIDILIDMLSKEQLQYQKLQAAVEMHNALIAGPNGGQDTPQPPHKSRRTWLGLSKRATQINSPLHPAMPIINPNTHPTVFNLSYPTINNTAGFHRGPRVSIGSDTAHDVITNAGPLMLGLAEVASHIIGAKGKQKLQMLGQ